MFTEPLTVRSGPLSLMDWRQADGDHHQSDPIWVFPYRGCQVSTMNNTAWQRARREAGLRGVLCSNLTESRTTASKG